MVPSNGKLLARWGRRRDSVKTVYRGSLMFSPFAISCALFIVYCYLSPLVVDVRNTITPPLLTRDTVQYLVFDSRIGYTLSDGNS